MSDDPKPKTKPKRPKPPGERRDVATRFKPGIGGPEATRFKPGNRIGVPGPVPMTTLTDEITERLAPEIGRTSIRGACQRLGVLRETFHEWRRRGERDRRDGIDSVEARLSIAVDQAIGERELRYVEGAEQGTVPERVAMFMLERLHPQDYQQRQAIEVEARTEITDVRARIEARLIRDLDATTIDGSVLAVDEPAPPLGLPEKAEP